MPFFDASTVSRSAMRLLFDTDAFCKLGISGLIEALMAALAVRPAECARLGPLPHMLRRGRLPKLYGVAACGGLVELAEGMPAAPAPNSSWVEPLVGAPGIDPGETQLLALAGEQALILVSGDKRALRAVAGIPAYVEALRGKIVTMEAALILLCRHHGVDEIRRATRTLAPVDHMIGVCFSPGNGDPVGALTSYLDALKKDVDPLVLWLPPEEDA